MFCRTIQISHAGRARTEFRMWVNRPKTGGCPRCAVAAGWPSSSFCLHRFDPDIRVASKLIAQARLDVNWIPNGRALKLGAISQCRWNLLAGGISILRNATRKRIFLEEPQISGLVRGDRQTADQWPALLSDRILHNPDPVTKALALELADVGDSFCARRVECHQRKTDNFRIRPSAGKFDLHDITRGPEWRAWHLVLANTQGLVTPGIGHRDESAAASRRHQ